MTNIDLSIALSMVEAFEGFRAKPYTCPAGVWTIGLGTTAYSDGQRVTRGDPPITLEEARALARYELEHTYAPGVHRLCPGLIADERKFNAIVDFAYNLGVGRLQTSTLRRKINAQDWDGAKEQLLLWTKAGGRVLPGLLRRRQAECLLMD